MTGEALRDAFFEGCAVTFRIDSMPGIELHAERIEAVTYRHIKGVLMVSAELVDGNKRTHYRVPARCVERLKKE